MKLFLLIITFYLFHYINAQSIFYQDIIKGGIIGVGFSPSYSDNSFNSNFNLPILPIGSNIKKAILIAGRLGNPDKLSFLFNNDNYEFNQSNLISQPFYSNVYGGLSGVHIVDVSNSINISQNTYSFSSISNINSSSNRFSDFYLLVEYENLGFQNSEVTFFVNDENFTDNINYSFNLQSANIGISPICLSIFSGYICNNNVDGTNVFLNGNLLGQIGGADIGSGQCGGPSGDFEYSNGNIFGLNSDNIDLNMSNSDLISSINTISQATNNLNLISIQPNNNTNSFWSFFLTHSTPCSPINVTTSPDTLVCKGATVQLNASGGSTYHWEPSVGLSCVDCPNPVLMADSSRLYTVRIANNDSCSVVRPVKVNVQTQAKLSSLSMNTAICGNNNGKIVAQSNAQPILYSLNNGTPQSSGTFQSLFGGNYTITLTDSLGCTTDSIVTVPEVNHTVASFSASPTTGTAPLSVQLTNTSVAATTYSWYVNNQFIGTQLPNFTFDTAGIYTIDLLAWKFDPSCADTATTTILVIDQLIVPTAFTPDKDQVNDTWEIANIDKCYPKNTVTVFNRWGAIVFESTAGSYSKNPWNGMYKGNLLPVGSYYFIIQPNDDTTETITGSVSLIYR